MSGVNLELLLERFGAQTKALGDPGRRCLRTAVDFTRFLWARWNREAAEAVDEAGLLAWLEHLLSVQTVEGVMMRLWELRPFLQFLEASGACPAGLATRVRQRTDLLQLLPGVRRYHASGLVHDDRWCRLLCECEVALRGLEPLTQSRILRTAADFAAYLQQRGVAGPDEAVFRDWLKRRLEQCGFMTVALQVNWIGRFCRYLVRQGLCATNPVETWRRQLGVGVTQALQLHTLGQPVPERPPLFASFLASHLEGFVAFKRQLGRPYRGLTALTQLDRYLQHVSATAVTADGLAGFLATQAHMQPGTRKNVVILLRQLLQYLGRVGQLEDPEMLIRSLPRVVRPPHRPCILTLKEIAAVLECLRNAPGRTPFDRTLGFTMLHLIYACGLRISEAGHLRMQDVDLAEGTLFIHHTKFGKDRLIPCGRRAQYYLTQFLEQRRERFGAETPDDPFFVRARGVPLSNATLDQWFRQAVRQAGITRGVRPSPRVHDLRHGFAVHRLYKWYVDGADPQERVVLLSLYMGHVSPENTQHYLQLSQDLLRVAGQSLEQQLNDWLGGDR